MRAAILRHPSPIASHPLSVEDVPIPEPGPDQVLLKIEACGVCRTDLHIASGDLKPQRDSVIPGHQIVGRVERTGKGVNHLKPKSRVGVSWMGGVDGDCPLCQKGQENLCDNAVFTGYSVNGGYAEYAVARASFCIPLPDDRSATTVAPLLCAGIIGFRSLRVAGVQPGDRVGLYGFGASAHLAIEVLHAWNCEVYVATRGKDHQQLARELGAAWVGDATEKPPVPLDSAVTFAPVGSVVIAALGALRKGGIVAINAIHLDGIPAFDYDSLLWGERQLRSVANMTRQDAKDFIAIAEEIGITPRTRIFSLDQANQALAAIEHDEINGAAVIVP
ncbi:MAG: zinc-dependent alcohol dehydrogenase family protein [Acidobacteriaceae bacterium]